MAEPKVSVGRLWKHHLEVVCTPIVRPVTDAVSNLDSNESPTTNTYSPMPTHYTEPYLPEPMAGYCMTLRNQIAVNPGRECESLEAVKNQEKRVTDLLLLGYCEPSETPDAGLHPSPTTNDQSSSSLFSGDRISDVSRSSVTGRSTNIVAADYSMVTSITRLMMEHTSRSEDSCISSGDNSKLLLLAAQHLERCKGAPVCLATACPFYHSTRNAAASPISTATSLAQPGLSEPDYIAESIETGDVD